MRRSFDLVITFRYADEGLLTSSLFSAMSPARDVALVVGFFKKFNTYLPAGRSSKCSRGSLKAQQQTTPNAKYQTKQQTINNKTNRLPPIQKSHSLFYQTNWKV